MNHTRVVCITIKVFALQIASYLQVPKPHQIMTFQAIRISRKMKLFFLLMKHTFMISQCMIEFGKIF